MSSYGSGGYIPPPFPFPEAWRALFQTQQTTWLAPTAALVPPPVFPFDTSTFASAREPAPESHADSDHAMYPFAARQDQQEDTYGSASESDDEPGSSGDRGDDGDDDGDSSEGEYVYGYVLSDEWCNRFRVSVQARQRLQQQQHREQEGAGTLSTRCKAPQSSKKGKKRRQDLLSAARSTVATGGRAVDLQRGLAAAKQREATQRRPISGAQKNSAELRQLETQLDLRFDEFCDAFQPVVWPYDAVH